jgi:hypothetical protein
MSFDVSPPLEWPALSDDASRKAWYLAVISAYAELWEGHPSQPVVAPNSDEALCSLETRLGCALPLALRNYHKEIGALRLRERLCGVEDKDTPIQPLLDAYPGIVDMEPSIDEMRLAEALIVFGDYLGNGNMFCFDRGNGSVYYFDHDGEALLTKFFDDARDLSRCPDVDYSC